MFVVMSVVCDAECVNEEVVTPTRGSAATKIFCIRNQTTTIKIASLSILRSIILRIDTKTITFSLFLHHIPGTILYGTRTQYSS